MVRTLRRRPAINAAVLVGGVVIPVVGGVLALTHRGDQQPKAAYLVLVVGGFVMLVCALVIPLSVRDTRRTLAAARGGTDNLGLRLRSGPSTIMRGQPMTVELDGSATTGAHLEVGLVRVRGRRFGQSVVDPTTGLSTSATRTECKVEWQEWQPVPRDGVPRLTFVPPPSEPSSYEDKDGCVWWSLRARPAGESNPQRTVLLRPLWVHTDG